ncbi:MAG: hypothetical protein PHR35_10970 [Kiritimatiellae bacterium]|nr:hypothetical protein [Kiritimatiellia bacterium]
MNPQPRHYVYKLEYDTGLAPCVDEDLWSLAVCKPAIRRRARKDDWVYGFAGNGNGCPLVFVAQVTEVIEKGDYYRSRRYAGHKDAIYRCRAGKLVPKRKGCNDSAHKPQAKDIGAPPYAAARVLLSTDFCYRRPAGAGAGSPRATAAPTQSPGQPPSPPPTRQPAPPPQAPAAERTVEDLRDLPF